MLTFNSRKRQVTEAEIEEVVNAVRQRIVCTAYGAEQKFGVSRSTICCWLKGLFLLPRLAQEDEQLLSKKEEESLGRWCEQYTRAGCPVLPLAVRDIT